MLTKVMNRVVKNNCEQVNKSCERKLQTKIVNKSYEKRSTKVLKKVEQNMPTKGLNSVVNKSCENKLGLSWAKLRSATL